MARRRLLLPDWLRRMRTQSIEAPACAWTLMKPRDRRVPPDSVVDRATVRPRISPSPRFVTKNGSPELPVARIDSHDLSGPAFFDSSAMVWRDCHAVRAYS